MTENFYKTELYKTNHTTFGGLIFPSDYNTDYRGKNNIHGSTIASRIVADEKFDNQCKKNIELIRQNGGIKNE